MHGQEVAEWKAAAAQVVNFGTSLDTFRLDVGRYPTTQEGLLSLNQRPSSADRWDGPYLKTQIPADPWGRSYYYRSPGEGGRPYDIYSLGADGAPGGDGSNRDVLSWESSKS
jgi:general secretion pathway protein G